MDEYESFAVAYVLDEYPGRKSLAEIFQLILEESDEVRHKSHDGITITVPKATRNFYVDGHVPKPH
jgi:hypothetical protein